MHNSLSKYLWTKKIDISSYTDTDHHEITLRQPNTAEMKQLVKVESMAKADETVMDAVELFTDMLKTIIVNHDFYDTDKADGARLPAVEVAEFVGSKPELAIFIIQEYLPDIPLPGKSVKK